MAAIVVYNTYNSDRKAHTEASETDGKGQRHEFLENSDFSVSIYSCPIKIQLHLKQ